MAARGLQRTDPWKDTDTQGSILSDPWKDTDLSDPCKDTDTQGEQFYWTLGKTWTYRGSFLWNPWKDTVTHGEQEEMVRRGQRVRGYVDVVQVLRSISSWQQSSQGATLPTIDLDWRQTMCET